MATHEFVVPRSMPMMSPASIALATADWTNVRVGAYLMLDACAYEV